MKATGSGLGAFAVVAVVAAGAHAARKVASAAAAVAARAGPGALMIKCHPIPGIFPIFPSFQFGPAIALLTCIVAPAWIVQNEEALL
jgi:hypothetical protein